MKQTTESVTVLNHREMGMMEQKKPEVEIRGGNSGSDDWFRLLFERAGIGIKRVAPDGRLLDANAKLAGILGYDRAELLGLSTTDVIHPDDLPAETERVARLLADDVESYAVEKRYLRKDGSVVWVRATTS